MATAPGRHEVFSYALARGMIDGRPNILETDIFDTEEKAIDCCDRYLLAQIKKFHGFKDTENIGLTNDSRWTYKHNKVGIGLR